MENILPLTGWLLFLSAAVICCYYFQSRIKNKSLVWVQALDKTLQQKLREETQHILSDIPVIQGFVVKGCVYNRMA